MSADQVAPQVKDLQPSSALPRAPSLGRMTINSRLSEKCRVETGRAAWTPSAGKSPCFSRIWLALHPFPSGLGKKPPSPCAASRSLMDDALRVQGGVVQSFTGDGIMAVFGAPVAFEDAPLRASRAALSILQRLRTAGPDLEAKHGVQPQLRIGLNTGTAVVGQVQEGAGAGVTVLGDTVNFAARLQALAEPNSVFMSEAMHRLVRGWSRRPSLATIRSRVRPSRKRLYRLNALRQGANDSRQRSAGVSALSSGVNTNWTCWRMASIRPAPNFASLISWQNRTASGWDWHLTGVDGIWGLALVLNGEINGGIQWIERAILSSTRRPPKAMQ